METVSFDLIKRIRKHIQRHERMSQLIPVRRKWIGITASIDVLEDTSWAIEYYLENEYPQDTRGKYLYTYGLLQTLFVQQDAASNIYNVFFDKTVDWKSLYPAAFEVRELRDDVTGHPLDRRKHFFIYLIQASLKKESLSYIKENVDEKEISSIDVDVMKSIEDSAKSVNRVMQEVLEKLDAEHKAYIDKFKDVKMVEIFRGLSYAHEKIICRDPIMGDVEYKMTKDMVQKCRDEIIKRYGSTKAIDAYDLTFNEIDDLYDLIDNEVPNSNMLRKEDVAYRLKENLLSKLEELEGLCKETDEYFEEEFEGFEVVK